MRYTVILVPDDEGRISAAVPAMPGCVSQGRSRDEALANIREAIIGWIETEAEQGRGPLDETPAVIAAGVSQALEIIDEMRQVGEAPADQGYQLELATVEPRHPAVA
jgi:predicted RNase H-like HicB family nuclease